MSRTTTLEMIDDGRAGDHQSRRIHHGCWFMVACCKYRMSSISPKNLNSSDIMYIVGDSMRLNPKLEGV